MIAPMGIYERRKKDYGEKSCVICKNPFSKGSKEKPYRFKRRQCCSRQCNALRSATFIRGKSKHTKERVERVCKFCGKITIAPPSQAERPFCNKKCMAGWMSTNQRGQNHRNWQGGKWKRYCLNCSKEFYFDKGELKRREKARLFCSQSCRAKYCHIGKGNPNWNGGITPESGKARNNYEAREWKIKCLERDEHQCQVCGNIEDLHIHHIIPFSEAPELRYSLPNGLTLCRGCHFEIPHRIQRAKNRN